MDFPTAWTIARATPITGHEPACSYAQTEGGLLCDCKVLTQHPQYLADNSYTDEELLNGIERALHARDMDAAAALIRRLAVQAPEMAQTILDGLGLAVELARG